MKKILSVGLEEKVISGTREKSQESGFNLVDAGSAKEAFNFIKKQKVSLVILNNHLPDLENYREFCLFIRSQRDMADVPIIVLAEQEEGVDAKIEILKSGLVNDYISLPAHTEEIAARVNIFIELRILQEELEIKNTLLKRMSITDEVTKIYNRRYILERLIEEIEYVKRYNAPGSCLLIDLDYFKKVNDKFGHQAGDQVLRELAKLLKDGIRTVDILGRYGGEEFLIILPHTDLKGAIIVAERLRNAAMSYSFSGIQEGLRVTLSIGVVSFSSSDAETLDKDGVVKKVDQRLYLAKRSGRNRVEAAEYGV